MKRIKLGEPATPYVAIFFTEPIREVFQESVIDFVFLNVKGSIADRIANSVMFIWSNANLTSKM